MITAYANGAGAAGVVILGVTDENWRRMRALLAVLVLGALMWVDAP